MSSPRDEDLRQLTELLGETEIEEKTGATHCLNRDCLRGSPAGDRQTALLHPETFKPNGCECDCHACERARDLSAQSKELELIEKRLREIGEVDCVKLWGRHKMRCLPHDKCTFCRTRDTVAALDQLRAGATPRAMVERIKPGHKALEELCSDPDCTDKPDTHWHPFSLANFLREDEGEYTITVRVRTPSKGPTE
jgi:hypothetical protein